MIIDNSPFSYLFQPTHAIPCTSWFQDRTDLQLYELLPFLDLIAQSQDVQPVIAEGKASSKYTFFGPVLQQPNIVVPWQPAQTGEETEVEQEAPGTEMIQVSVGS